MMKMFNQTLKFSLAHVLAIVALLVLSYCTFAGVVYYTGGDFSVAGWWASGTFLVLGFLMYCVQLLKAAERRFARRIWWERVVALLLVLGSIVSFFPVSHFWNVYARSEQLSSHFQDAIGSSQRIFSEYTRYTDGRRIAYERQLYGTRARSEAYKRVGFIKGIEGLQVSNCLQTMQIRHRGTNYERLSAAASEWIESCNKDITPMNVFLLGNIVEIRNAVGVWHAQLQGWTRESMSWEQFDGVPFGADSIALRDVFTKLESVGSDFSSGDFPNWIGWLVGIALFATLSLPYHIQPRHTKAQRYYGFWRFSVSGGDSMGLSGGVVSAAPRGGRRRRSVGFTLDE